MTEQREDRHPCRDPEVLQAYALDRLPSAEHSAVDSHCRECAECRQLLAEELRLAAGVRRMARQQMKERLSERLSRARRREVPWPRIAAIAATILIVAGVSIIGIWLQRREPETMSPPVNTSAESRPATDRDRNRPEPPAPPPTRKEKKSQDFANELKDTVSEVFWTEGIVSHEPPATPGEAYQHEAENVPQPALRSRTGAVSKAAVPSPLLTQQVVLSQQSSRLHQAKKRNLLPTLIRQVGGQLSLTLYPDTLFPAQDLQQAVVRRAGDDSLLIQVGNQLIQYRLPSSLIRQLLKTDGRN